MNKLPHHVFSYIRKHFREGYFRNIESVEVEDKDGHLLFRAKIYENEIIHYLEFNAEGQLLKHETEAVFEEDYYEGGFYGKE